MSESTPWVVCKFGGTSVSSRARWDTIAEVVRTHRNEGRHPFLVCSALQGISDQLEVLVREATDGDPRPTLNTIRDRHRALAADLEVDAETTLNEGFERLESLTEEIMQEDSPSPRQRAAVMASGELLSTRLGVAYLSAQGVPVEWLDAREFLRAKDDANVPPRRQYLAATCASHSDPVLQSHLNDNPDTLYLTQGFIASNALGETVLLGRGGSDTSAAHFAAKLQAERLEIWTDVPGMFTANPSEVPSARLLRRLGYDEAQELATMGARVLHPRCLGPVKRHRIPLHIRSTEDPKVDGTIVAGDGPDVGPHVKAISAKDEVTAVSMDTLGMWQEVGFLADVFQIFKHHGLSVDLVATSEANVTVTLDPQANALDADVLDRLLHDLNQYCDAELIRSCAVVSLVGRHIRSLLSDLGPAFEVFDEKKVHLVTQAASDLNMSFVVDEEQAPRLVRELHAQFFGAKAPDAIFGPRWQELVDSVDADGRQPDAWWRDRREDLLTLADEQSPRYVYSEATIREKSDDVHALEAIEQPFYAIKANPHPDVLRLLEEEGVGFECVSPGELDRVFEAVPDIDPERVLFQPNFAAPEEYAEAFERGVHVTLDNVQPLVERLAIFANEEIFVRVDPGEGHGHHRHVRTAGAQSKFGVVPAELERLRAAADRAGTSVVGLHVHVGSGITDEDTWADLVDFLASLATDFPDVRTLNVGGGLGVPDRPGAAPVDLDSLNDVLNEAAARHPQYTLWMEPGRYLVAEAGVLLAQVTQTKAKGPVHYIGLDTGMNSLIRPALYGAYHEIANLSRLGDALSVTADVVGPICETGDVLGHNRQLPDTDPGDVLLVATTGAYGASMANHYNLRPPAEEVLLSDD
ncbi:diaminopimelate decarboxylase [Salinibacter sp. 10B]|uniref:bifunctional aspartate kinase/diaminopimelate decarboxylase n=1 Tax=Salinibacter sp. 10B TaxID=1923971 RepID=UPI000CF4529F|nr:bifunctional aspartate kinase/diaminopimelate decarboxylase [Salinibacter sp. 10B]PQJ35272.1 diaminopimelate decarboxylase [Salinibacter sp. 10B]